MNNASSSLRRARLALAAAGCAWALGAAAQSGPADSDAPLSTPGLVVSDVEPLPADDRDSQGAVLIEGSPVRAQQNQRRAAPVVPSAIGRNAAAVVERTRSWDEVQEADAQRQAPAGEASGAPR